ncbi:uncharacterized protein LOC120416595 isoform X1 [Culex pipiens pallens]|uniref:uncharacterized protein LOC120416595 isoform X1 n=1 Tax=Culex pipiens pallens TaxID=42434 RepID=UPI001954B008|nr:uncharacterized protein LOC120416595 isoform X1 [Culex pipiens pallens]
MVYSAGIPEDGTRRNQFAIEELVGVCCFTFRGRMRCISNETGNKRIPIRSCRPRVVPRCIRRTHGSSHVVSYAYSTNPHCLVLRWPSIRRRSKIGFASLYNFDQLVGDQKSSMTKMLPGEHQSKPEAAVKENHGILRRICDPKV